MKRDVKMEVFYNHPPERVWRALTDKEALSEWLMETDFEPRVGAKYLMRSKPMGNWDGTVRGEVLEAEPPRRLVYTWKGGGSERPTMTVTWLLQPENGGTRLRLEHTGFVGVGGFLLSFMMGSGWKKMLRTKVPNILGRYERGATGSPAHAT